MANRKYFIIILITSILVSSLFGSVAGFLGGVAVGSDNDFNSFFKEVFFKGEEIAKENKNTNTEKIVKIEEESAVIDAVEKNSPAVVSIIVSKDLPVIEKYYREPSFGDDFFGDFFGDFFNFPSYEYREKGTEKREIGGGTGFILSSDGYIVTNKHVVVDEDAEYTVLMNNETKHEAEVLARDPINDIAILKIDAQDLKYVELGDSSNLKVGQSVIAIGNALGEFRNTVSTGVISGLSRFVVAGGSGMRAEELTGVIQTDTAINPGNSGGPLLNLSGQAIGINTAMAQGAENIGFAIPINEIKNIFESVREHGKIVRPWLGVRYVLLNEVIAEENKLEVDYGALIIRGESRTELAVIPGSPADKAGLMENDIILEVNGKKIDNENPLHRAISKFSVGEEVELTVLKKGEKKKINIVLEEME